MSDANLLRRITAAFADRTLPQGLPLTENPDDWEARDMEEFFGRKTWDELTAADLKREGQVDQFFTVKAYAYFLPAYLTQAVSNPEDLDVCVQHLVWRFSPDEGNTWGIERARSILGILSESELGVLRDYLRYARNRWSDLNDSYSRAIANVEAELESRRG